MPLYRYVAPRPGRCKHCRDGLEVMQKASDAPLTECPYCGLPVERQVTDAVFQPRILRKPGAAEARQKGFQVWKKIGEGEYERQ